ncbi:MAG TPA: FAD-binding and (Fe-S)-binding domain-containing protein [Tepidisphaeraceae bacterium]|jgi:FAD/FMN-containing dehydrogenase/Fe-S oxidoreductase|nr:FAD-binding and (Fe-S)-binding domain-containing protein [Tepidisphaeraceae bacterium]
MTSLTVLREEVESNRFHRLETDDSRTAIPPVDADALAAELSKVVEGEVRFDKGSRALYSTDGSNYRQVPIGVVIPRHAGDVEQTMALARRYGAPILSRGGGTSLAGQCCNVAVVMDFSKYMHRILEIDPVNRVARVEPGCVLDHLRTTGSKQHGLTFGPDPETHDHCTLGGMLGNNSCGVHSLMCRNNGLGLRMSDNTRELEILTYEGHRFRVGATSPDELERIIRRGDAQGQIYGKLKALRDKYADVIRTHMPRLPRRVSGYNLDDLLPENGFNVARVLVGSESTLVTILEGTVQLIPNPKARSLLIFGYPDIYSAAEHVMEILEFNPTGLEGIDNLLFKFVKDKGDENANLALLPPGGGYLLVEFGGDSKRDTEDQARRCMAAIGKSHNPPSMKLYDDPQQEEMIWKVREGSLGSTAWVPGMPDTWEGWEDSAVPVPKVADYLRDLRALLDKYDYHPTLYGHLGQGCIHTRIPFDLYTTQGIAKYRSFINEATDLVVKFGGSFSGEHGDGQSRGEWLPKMFGPELMQAFREFKSIWDPQWKMNPGKVIDAYSMTENLRLGPDYNPPQPQTYFHYEGDKHSFARAALRCVGVGECRRHGEQTMCPSYMVTNEEMHSTRGRARLLFEMLNGEVIDEGWKSPEVKEALDLCLSCKGCKGDCPVNVDMATYKAEFLAHYYEGKIRPRHAFAFGLIHVWSRLASAAPNLLNFFTQTPGLSAVAKFIAGMDQRRSIPPFAPEPFKRWFARRQPKNLNGPPVMLFPDTFNNYYHPDTSKAAVEVLEDAGFCVQVPMQDICCGRPLYDYGFLNIARRWARNILDTLRPQIQAGIPMVVLEPSCWAVFKDELTNILPAQDEDAIRLQRQTFTFSDFLKKNAPQYRVPRLHRKALLHGHCHQKALDRLNDKAYGELYCEKDVLKEMGVEYDLPKSGCCGMAGAFGYETGDHYDVSVACGERVLLPDVRKRDPGDFIIADGFSCQEQIEQDTDRTALHMAQVMQIALHNGPSGPARGRPEDALLAARRKAHLQGGLRTAGLLAAGALAGALIWKVRRPKESVII